MFEKIREIKENIGKEPQIAKIVKDRYQEVRKWFKKSYFIILFLTLLTIILNFNTLFKLIKSEEVEINGILPLLLTIGLFILIVVPLMGIVTRKKCPHCHEIVLRDAEICHKCGCEMKFYK